MKQNKQILVILAVLMLLTAALALMQLQRRDTIPKGSLMLSRDGQSTYIELARLPLTERSGTVINGKGEEKTVSGQGLALFSLAPADVQAASVVAEDEYSAAVGIEDAENAFLFIGEDGHARLVVFGDSDARRDVKHVVRVEFR